MDIAAEYIRRRAAAVAAKWRDLLVPSGECAGACRDPTFGDMSASVPRDLESRAPSCPDGRAASVRSVRPAARDRARHRPLGVARRPRLAELRWGALTVGVMLAMALPAAPARAISTGATGDADAGQPHRVRHRSAASPGARSRRRSRAGRAVRRAIGPLVVLVALGRGRTAIDPSDPRRRRPAGRSSSSRSPTRR